MTIIEACHGTTAQFTAFEASRARAPYDTPHAAYQYGGERVLALTRVAGVWVGLAPGVADGYAEGPSGRVLDVTITAERVTYLEWTDEDSVVEALAASPQVLVLEDRYEAIVLDLACIAITGSHKSCGCELDAECGCWDEPADD